MKLAISLKKLWIKVSCLVRKYWMWLVLILILTGFLILTAFVDSKSAIGMIGVTVGALISGFFSYFVNETNYKKQLRLAALDKRLEAHQQAYSLWLEIRMNIYKRDELDKIIQKSLKWWADHCLFLGPKSRTAFYNCLSAAERHNELLDAASGNSYYQEAKVESWKKIVMPGITLVQEMELPSLSDEINVPEKPEKK